MKAKRCTIFRHKGTYSIKEHGLFGKEREILDAMFSKDKETTIRFPKLSSLQKKVLRKMNLNKLAFIQ